MRCNIKAVLMTSVAGVFMLGTAPSQAQLTYNQVTTYSYSMPNAEPTVKKGKKTLVSTSCGGGGGGGGTVGPSWGAQNGASGDTTGSYSDSTGDGTTDSWGGAGVGAPDSYGGHSTASPGESSGGPGSGGTVLCTYFYKKGCIPRKVYVADGRYGQMYVSEQTVRGYHYWAVPLIGFLQTGKHPVIEKILERVIVGWAYQMAYKMGAYDRPNVIGYILTKTMEPLCTLIGKYTEQRDWRPLWDFSTNHFSTFAGKR